MLKQGDKLKTEFNDYVLDLTNEMLDAYDKFELPQLAPTPALKDVTNAFREEEAQAGAPAADAFENTGPRSAVFIIVAAKPDEIATVGRLGTKAYENSGGGDWKPYFPEKSKRIYALAAHEATGDDLDFNPEEKPFTADLASIVLDAEAKRKIVIIIVDSWTARLPTYREGLQMFDRQNYINCAVLVPLNRNDKESESQSAVLADALRDAIPWRSKNYKNTIYYRDDIQSEEDLRNRIRDTLTRLRSEVLAKATVQRAMPGAGALPTFRV
jgi:FxsC-like protein